MKDKFEFGYASDVAAMVREQLKTSCARIEIAGSLRRRKKEIGDIEIVYIPKTAVVTEEDLFGQSRNLTDRAIAALENSKVLERRKNIKGREAFGDHIKLMRDVSSGVPVDLFATTEAAWWNYLVCRTGGAQSNMRIAALAKSRGYKWEPYSAGFWDPEKDETIPMQSEEDVFRFVGLPYEEPAARP